VIKSASRIAIELEAEIAARLKRKDFMLAEIQTIDSELSQLRQARSAIDEMSKSDVPATERPSAVYGRSGKTKDIDIILDFARKEMLATGKPMTRFEIVRAMANAGIYLSSKDPPRRVGKVLWGSSDFISTGDGYWLSDAELPQPEPEGVDSEAATSESEKRSLKDS
jgi:hypothetical protein